MLHSLVILIRERFPLIPLGFFSLSYVTGILFYSQTNYNPFQVIHLALVIITFLFALRCNDEVRDYEYDAQFHPERPVVRGAISARLIKNFSIIAILLFIALILKPYTLLPLLLFCAYELFMLNNLWIQSLLKKKGLLFVLSHNAIFILLTVIFMSYIQKKLWYPTSISDIVFLLLLQIPIFIIEVGRKLHHRYTPNGVATDDTYIYNWGQISVLRTLNLSLSLAGILLFCLHKPLGLAFVVVSIILGIVSKCKAQLFMRFAVPIYFFTVILIPLFLW